jgi:amino acid adenylation domain-containing protein
MTVRHDLLYSGFLRSAQAMPNRPALFVNGRIVTYSQLWTDAAALAATLQESLHGRAPRLTAVFADKSRAGFAAILGALLAGHGYVPLNVRFPIGRTRRMLQHAGCISVIVDSSAETQLDSLLEGVDTSLLIILAERDEVETFAERWPRHTFIGAQGLAPASARVELDSASELAYLLFTSGTSGVPKAVGVTHASVMHFIDTTVERYGVTRNDRFSQMFDTTFDLSVFDLFVAWHCGASVYCPSRATLLNPDQFIREHELTVWFSVPTVGLLMKRLGALKAGRYPSLRWSLFCGEPLPKELAEAWTAAAPVSRLENLYGPTELTVACTAYRWHPVTSPAECCGDIVPIGAPIGAMRARVVDERLVEVAPGHVGELLMAGPQRAPGYFRDAEATARAFVRRADGDVYYRTGDRVRRPVGDGPLAYIGRVDHQIKVLGHRVELSEIEYVLRQEPGVREAVALGWPRTSTGTAGVVAFVTGSEIDVAGMRARVGQKLQRYAVPQTIRVLTALPQNANGKVDRQALISLLNS